MKLETFHEKLKNKLDDYVHFVYKITRKFPNEEMYGVISQLRRAALSTVLNYVEGYARNFDNKNKVHKNFLEIAYGSLQESKYLLGFSFKEGWMEKVEYENLLSLSNDIGAMLWGILKNIKP